jgi:FkbM family methyltransferase
VQIFVDIGAHIGESLEVALERQYSLKRLLALEPSAFGLKHLHRFRDSRLEIFDFGVGNRDSKEVLYGAGSVGGSLFKDKVPHWDINEEVSIRKFSTWFKKHIQTDDQVWIKINVEGAEKEVIEELRYLKNYNIESVLISFDVEKVPSRRKYKTHLIDILKKELGIKYFERSRDFGVREWLDASKSRKSITIWEFPRVILRPELPLFRNVRRILKPLIPEKLWFFLAMRFGPNRRK